MTRVLVHADSNEVEVVGIAHRAESTAITPLVTTEEFPILGPVPTAADHDAVQSPTFTTSRLLRGVPDSTVIVCPELKREKPDKRY